MCVYVYVCAPVCVHVYIYIKCNDSMVGFQRGIVSLEFHSNCHFIPHREPSGHTRQRLPTLLIYEVLFVLWLSSSTMDTATRVQILDGTVCISYSANDFGKGMNPITLLSSMVNSKAFHHCYGNYNERLILIIIWFQVFINEIFRKFNIK